MRLVGLGHHNNARGVLVKAMDDTRPAHAADPREAVAAMGEQGIDQGAGVMAGGGMNNQSRRLVDHDKGVIFVNDIEGDALRLGHHVAWRWYGRDNMGSRFDPVARLHYGLAVHPHMAFGDQPLKTRATHVMEVLTEDAIETFARFCLGDGE